MSVGGNVVTVVVVIGAIFAMNFWQRGVWGLFTPVVVFAVFALTILATRKFGRGWGGWAKVAAVQWLFVAAAIGFLWIFGTLNWWLLYWLAMVGVFTIWAYRQAD